MNAQHNKWLDESLDLCPEIVRPEAREYLQPLLRRCHAKSKKTFWQWLRIQLARTEDSATFLEWMQESRCPLEVKTSSTGSEGGFQYFINGDIALISVGDAEHPAVWQIPLADLEWALSLYPVTLKKLPALESPERREIRRLKRQLRTRMPFLTPGQRSVFEQSIKELEAAQGRAYTPLPRYQLLKSIAGRETPVHRMYLNAQRNDEISAVDGDFLNFATTRVLVTVAPVSTEGVAIAKGSQPPTTYSADVVVPNLQIVNDDDAQKEFESSALQVKLTPQGDIKISLKIQPNSKWLAGVDGHVADCGPSAPVSWDEAKDAGLSGFEARGLDEVAALRRKWRVPTNSWGSRW